jgi:hypothetical protein
MELDSTIWLISHIQKEKSFRIHYRRNNNSDWQSTLLVVDLDRTKLINKTIVGMHISDERKLFVAENFIRSLVDKYGRHTVYTDGGTWYPQACNFLHLKHTLHSTLEKSLIERVMQYF